MRSLKALLDPTGILNRGRVLPWGELAPEPTR
ncbi:MAG: hypothetical protein QOE53_1897 [Pseudonocardiales bacterium]|jgi:FAD/FMN-containing dehydrogenase|nr:hypothetical protein [Pseudonocardiales bacterium]